MNIAFVNSTHGWGGIKTWTLDVGRELLKRGHSVSVFARQAEFVARAREAGLAAERFWFGPDFNPVAVYRLLRRFMKRRIDRVVVNVGRDLKTGGVAAWLVGIPVVQRVGLPGDMEYSGSLKLLHGWLKPRFLTPCQFVKDGFRRELPYVADEAVKVIHNAKVPVENPDLSVGDPRVLVTTSQLKPEKEHRTVLRALAGIDIDYRYVILGTGSMEAELMMEAAQLGIADKVAFAGFQQNIGDYLRRADIFVFPSKGEGLPNALLEAMAHGLAVVSRDVGGVAEIWPHYLEDWLLPYNSGVDEFRERLEMILGVPDEELRALKLASLRACGERFHVRDKITELETWLHGLGPIYSKKRKNT